MHPSRSPRQGQNIDLKLSYINFTVPDKFLLETILFVYSICEQYRLENCLKDPQELVDLVKLLEVEENHKELTAKNAIEKML